MDELDHNLLEAWHRVFERCRADPAEARRRYQRTLPGTCLDRPVRAWCVAIRASDTRLIAEGGRGEGLGGSGGSRGAQVAHEVVLDGEVIQRLGGPVEIPYPGVPMTEAAKMLGRNCTGLRHWIPVGAGRSRVERDALAAKGDSDGRLIWATFEKAGYPLKVRYEPPGKHGRRGRETPVVWSDHALDPGAAKGLPPASWWGSLWMSMAEKIPYEFEQVVERVPKFLPCKGKQKFRGWLWRCPGLGSAGAGAQDVAIKSPPMTSAREKHASGCGRLVPKLFAPLPAWTIGRYLDIEEGLDVAGLSGQWYPGVMDRWAGRRSLACRHCWRVRNGGAAERHGWNEFVSHLSGGLLFGHEVQQPADFQYERRRADVKRSRKHPEKPVRPGEVEMPSRNAAERPRVAHHAGH